MLLVTVALTSCGTTPRQTRLPAAPAGGETDGAPLQQVDFDSIPEPEPRMEPYSKYGNPTYYEVNGRLYHTLSSSAGYVERGIASWYGTKFHGRRTSSGEPYDLYAVTAAHKTLPLPSYVLVTNLNNGRNLVARVNDRGPFHQDRIIDLSYAAAGKLGVLPTGTALVEVRAIQPGEPLPSLVARVGEAPPYEIPAEPNEAPVPLVASADSQLPVGIEQVAPGVLPAATLARPYAAESSDGTTSHSTRPSKSDGRVAGYPAEEDVRVVSPPVPEPGPVSKPAGGDRIYLQIGAFKSRPNAERVRDRIAKVLHTAVEVINTAAWYRVRLGPMLSNAEAAEATAALAKLGLGAPQRVNQ
ncbi:MAG: septal ring lytic transglycosylase RlpA family protein [Gammaproteobacteria bacterium]